MPMSSFDVNTIRFFSIISVIILAGWFYLIVKAYDRGFKGKALIMVFYAFISRGLFEFFCVAIKKRLAFSEYRETALKAPLWIIVLIEAVLLALLIYEFYTIVKSEKERISANSVSEGLNNMPAGIAFSTAEGVPLLVNSKMKSIAHTVFDSEVVDTNELSARLKNGELSVGCEVNNTGGSAFLLLPDNTVWNVSENTISVKNKDITETVAYDITQQYNQMLELEKRNRHLEKVNAALKDYSEKQKEAVIAKDKKLAEVGYANYEK